MAEIDAVLLDADGVVQHPPADWLAAVRALCPDVTRTEAFLADVFAAERPCLVGDEDFRTALADVLDRWGSRSTLIDALAVWTQIALEPEVLTLVASVRATGTPVALATNQQAHRAAHMTHHLNYASHFDHLFYSCELRVAKPDAAFFRSAVARLGIEPSRALFMDDHDTNVAAARACGLQAQRFHVSEGHDVLRALFAEYGIGV